MSKFRVIRPRRKERALEQVSIQESRRIIRLAASKSKIEEEEGDEELIDVEVGEETVTLDDVIDHVQDSIDMLTAVAQSPEVSEEEITELLDQLPDLKDSHDAVYASVGLEPPVDDGEAVDDLELDDEEEIPDEEGEEEEEIPEEEGKKKKEASSKES